MLEIVFCPLQCCFLNSFVAKCTVAVLKFCQNLKCIPKNIYIIRVFTMKATTKTCSHPMCVRAIPTKTCVVCPCTISGLQEISLAFVA